MVLGGWKEGLPMVQRRRVGVTQRFRKSIAVFHVVGIVLIAAGVGCNNSRYGITYKERLPSIKRVAILPAVVVGSMHTGGVEERRPDIEPDVSKRMLEAVREILLERGCEIVARGTRSSSDVEPDDDLAVRFARLNAIRDAIVTHHYKFGKSVLLDYPTGDAARVIAGNNGADVLLYVALHGVVPTAGRGALAGTAFVVGILTGIHVHVTTNQAYLVLMLIDCETGDVLWFDHKAAETDVRGKHRLRRFIRKGCAYLLKPRK